MIFVTVGTHEQPFNRLVKCIDELKITGVIQEDVIIQTGYSTYIPMACEWSKLYSYKEMMNLVEEARIVITHGGPSSFIMPLQNGKIPIVVPRQKQFDEHVNDHQKEFTEEVAERQKNIILVNDVENLEETILQYDEIIKNMSAGLNSNNIRFCDELEEIVNEMF